MVLDLIDALPARISPPIVPQLILVLVILGTRLIPTETVSKYLVLLDAILAPILNQMAA